MELHRRGAELLFQVLTEREEKASVAIASNESFRGWPRPFPAPPPLRRHSPRPSSSSPAGSPPTPPRSPCRSWSEVPHRAEMRVIGSHLSATGRKLVPVRSEERR